MKGSLSGVDLDLKGLQNNSPNPKNNVTDNTPEGLKPTQQCRQHGKLKTNCEAYSTLRIFKILFASLFVFIDDAAIVEAIAQVEKELKTSKKGSSPVVTIVAAIVVVVIAYFVFIKLELKN